MVTTDQSLIFIVKNRNEVMPGYWTIAFQRPKGFEFMAGDWIDIDDENKNLSGGKTYSLASSPTEKDIMIAFRSGMSERKQMLQSIQPGEVVVSNRYGNDYGFRLKPGQASVLVAGGVGIAPFRSMIMQIYDTGDRSELLLLYLNQDKNFLFKEELDVWTRDMPNISVVYIITKELNRKKREKLLKSYITNSNQNFYISGPPGMVDSTEHLLIDSGVLVRNIKIDVFGGY
ncbi:FAD-dependent oxidoreductase [Candidatus Saccharibacteria bacterium]|nr:FAD-dependent oxidoreductase [Candidatus Saccharibacteria bacterium]